MHLRTLAQKISQVDPATGNGHTSRNVIFKLCEDRTGMNPDLETDVGLED